MLLTAQTAIVAASTCKSPLDFGRPAAAWLRTYNRPGAHRALCGGDDTFGAALDFCRSAAPPAWCGWGALGSAPLERMPGDRLATVRRWSSRSSGWLTSRSVSESSVSPTGRRRCGWSREIGRLTAGRHPAFLGSRLRVRVRRRTVPKTTTCGRPWRYPSAVIRCGYCGAERLRPLSCIAHCMK